MYIYLQKDVIYYMKCDVHANKMHMWYLVNNFHFSVSWIRLNMSVIVRTFHKIGIFVQTWQFRVASIVCCVRVWHHPFLIMGVISAISAIVQLKDNDLWSVECGPNTFVTDNMSNDPRHKDTQSVPQPYHLSHPADSWVQKLNTPLVYIQAATDDHLKSNIDKGETSYGRESYMFIFVLNILSLWSRRDTGQLLLQGTAIGRHAW